MPGRKGNDFSEATKDRLAKRVQYFCSNPTCRVLTLAAVADPDDASSLSKVGVAAHIVAAANGRGATRVKRPDEKVTLHDIGNGIWLCQTCSKLIDTDEYKFTRELLHEWKRNAEAWANENIGKRVALENDLDKQILLFLRVCLDRRAFQDHLFVEGSYDNLREAMEDTLIAINTGTLVTRKGTQLQASHGKSFISNQGWAESLDEVADKLGSLLKEYDRQVKLGKLHNNENFYCFNERSFVDIMNSERADIIEIMNSVFAQANIRPLRFGTLKDHY